MCMYLLACFITHRLKSLLRYKCAPFSLVSRQNVYKTRIDVYETLCPQQMLVHKGGKIQNWGGECRDVTPTKSLSQNIRVDVNREDKFLLKLFFSFFFFFFFFWGGGQVGGGEGGSQGGCEQRIEVFVKIKKKQFGWVGLGGGGVRVDVNEELSFCENSKKKWGGGGRGRGRVWGVRVDVIEELKSFWENSQKKKFQGGSV